MLSLVATTAGMTVPGPALEAGPIFATGGLARLRGTLGLNAGMCKPLQ